MKLSLLKFKKFFRDEDYFLRVFFGSMGILSGITLAVFLLLYALGVWGFFK